MLKDLFLAPGRMLAKFFSRSRKKDYRSPRERTTISPATVILSLAAWLVLAGLALYSADKAGLLKDALDRGAAVVNQAEEAKPTPPAPAPPPASATASGSLLPPPRVASPPPTSQTPSGPAPAVTPPASETWLVILHTIPKNSEGRVEAERRQKFYGTKGLKVEIMDTDAFPRLKSGNWILALGPFDDKAGALAAANRAKAHNPGLRVVQGL
ncbi:MAG: hypothetical protein LBP55_03810 [Candidatus Adiutrix sp.]|nr:hypothetical protein [Candidatus Adiutrix sp.]